MITGCAAQPLDSEADTVRTKGPVPLVAWEATFPSSYTDVALKSAGAYTAGRVQLNMDSAAPTTAGPNGSGNWDIIPNAASPAKGAVVFSDSKPAIAIKDSAKEGEAPYDIKDGTISSLASVDQMLTDTRIEATVNVKPPKGGSVSKQGAMARWEAARYVTCFVDFSDGTAHLIFAKDLWTYVALGNTSVADFKNTKPYRVSFDVVDITGVCRIYDGTKLVATVGPVEMPEIAPEGMAGVMFHVSLGAPSTPLHGSASEITAYSL